MRIFIAVDLSDEAKKEVKKLYKILEKKHWNVKWEPIEKIHLTLAFFPELDKRELLLIKDVIQNTCYLLQSIKVGFKGLGCFPDFEWPRIIWLGLKGNLKSLSALQKIIKKELIREGFKIDGKPFVPHLTLGRVKRARAKERREIGRQMTKMREIDFKSEWVIDEVVVYESKRLPEGSKYSKLFLSPLGG